MAKIIRLKSLKELEDRLKPAIEALARGELVIYPTDTVYGLGADPFSAQAVEKVYRAKKRDPGKPLPVLVADIDSAKKIAVVSREAEILMKAFWPGPLTIVLPRKPSLPSIVTGGKPAVGVRMSSHPVALALARGLKGAIIGTSANISGNPPPLTVQAALRELGDAVNVAVDAGPARIGIPSTVVDLTAPVPRLLRKGPIGLADIMAEIRRAETET